MTHSIRLPIVGLLLSTLLFATTSQAQLTPIQPTAEVSDVLEARGLFLFAAGSDGVGGIEWSEPRAAPTSGPIRVIGSFSIGEASGNKLLPKSAPSRNHQPLGTAPEPEAEQGDDEPGLVAQSPAHGFSPETASVLQLVPVGTQTTSKPLLAGLLVRGVSPDERGFLLIGDSVPGDGGTGVPRLVTRPSLVLPLGQASASGEKLLLSSAAEALSGMTVQAWFLAEDGTWRASEDLRLE